jgi:hypothetical protein
MGFVASELLESIVSPTNPGVVPLLKGISIDVDIKCHTAPKSTF